MKIRNIFFVAKTRSYGIFVVKIYGYALIDSFWGTAGFLDSPTSYATLEEMSITQTSLDIRANKQIFFAKRYWAYCHECDNQRIESYGCLTWALNDIIQIMKVGELEFQWLQKKIHFTWFWQKFVLIDIAICLPGRLDEWKFGLKMKNEIWAADQPLHLHRMERRSVRSLNC